MGRLDTELLCRTLEGFAGPFVLPRFADYGLLVRIQRGWWRHGSCASADPEAWFPEPNAKPEPAVERVCATCPVRKSCLSWALLADESGIWAGTRRGQRLHARARMVNGDPPGDVVGDLLRSPLAETEYAVPDPAATPVSDPTPLPVHADTNDQTTRGEAA